MRIIKPAFQIVTVLLHAAIFLISAAPVAAVEDSVVLALEPSQGKVVVKTAMEGLKVLKVGDVFPGSSAVIKQVLTDRVVAEEIVGSDRPVVQQLWIYKSKSPDLTSRVERFLLELPEKSIAVPDQVSEDIYYAPSPNPRGVGQ